VARLLADATELHSKQISAYFRVADLKKYSTPRGCGARAVKGTLCLSTRCTASTAPSRTHSWVMEDGTIVLVALPRKILV